MQVTLPLTPPEKSVELELEGLEAGPAPHAGLAHGHFSYHAHNR